MSEMTKYGQWFEQDRRTVRSRGIVLDPGEMLRAGIVEVINYTAVMDDGMEDQERMHTLMRQGLGSGRYVATDIRGILFVASRTRAVLVDTAMRGVKDESTGETNYIRVYSGIVFLNEWMMNLYVLRNREMYPDLDIFPRLVN